MKLSLKTALLSVFQALIIFVPLTWTSTTSELFEFPKMELTYAFVIVILGLWLARMVVEKRFIFRRSPLELPIVLFLGSQLISTLFSIDLHTSLFGYYSRFNGGFLSLISYSLLYFAAVSNFDLPDAKRLLKTLVFAAVVSSLYAFPEHFGHSPSCAIISGQFNARCWVQDVQSRVFGTFGQPNWLAAYLAVVLPLTLFTAVHTKRSDQRLLYAGISLLMVATILFTKSQSGIGATAIALILSFIILTVQRQKQVLLLGLLPLCLLVLVFKPAAVSKTLASLNNINPFYSTTAAIVAKDNLTRVGGTDSMIIRRVVWSGAWELAKRHPLFGTGVETFGYAYYSVRPAEHNLVSEWDFLYNKAHNEFLNYAATTGFVGLSAYLILLGAFVSWCLKHSRSSPLPPPPATSPNAPSTVVSSDFQASWLTPAFLTGFIALAVSNFFGFSTVPVNTLLFLLPALAYLLTLPQPASSPSPSHPPLAALDYLSLGLLGFTSLILLLAVDRGFTTDQVYAQGRSFHNAGDYQQAVTDLQAAVKAVPDEPLYTDELSLTASEIAQTLHANGQTREASEAATIAMELSNRTLNLNKVHLNFYKTRAKVFINLSRINPAYVTEAAATLDAAIKLAPTDAKLWYNRALLTQQLGDNLEAQKLYDQTLALKPDYESARFQYGQLLEAMGQPDQAAAQYQYSLAHINPHNTQAQAALAAIATRSAGKR